VEKLINGGMSQHSRQPVVGSARTWHAGGAGGGDDGPRAWPEPAVVEEKPTVDYGTCRRVALMAPRGGVARLGDKARSGR
jgi:hypothetical protein